MDDPSAMGKKLGFYAITVVMGLVLHGLFILPAMYFFITKKSPIVYIRGILQALLISLATSSRYKNLYFSVNSLYLYLYSFLTVWFMKICLLKDLRAVHVVNNEGICCLTVNLFPCIGQKFPSHEVLLHLQGIDIQWHLCLGRQRPFQCLHSRQQHK